MSAPTPPAAYDRDKFEAWRNERGHQPFSSEFNLILMRRMRDEKLDDLTRYVSWLTLYAGGNFSHWPVDSEGNEKLQRDCVRDTGMTRQRVSDAVRRAAELGYVILAKNGPRGRMIQPDGSKNDAQWNQQLNSELSGRSGQDSPFLRYRDFAAKWLAEHQEEQAEIAKAQAIVNTINLRILSEWKTVKQTAQKNGDEAGAAPQDLSEPSGQIVRNGEDKMSGTGAKKERPIIRSSESLKKSNSERKAGGPVRRSEEPARPLETPFDPDPLTEALTQRGYRYLTHDEDAMKTLRAALGDTPLDVFAPILDERLKRAKTPLGFAIILDKARQARKTWEAGRMERGRERAAAERAHRNQLLACLGPDSILDEHDKQLVREELAQMDKLAKGAAG